MRGRQGESRVVWGCGLAAGAGGQHQGRAEAAPLSTADPSEAGRPQHYWLQSSLADTPGEDELGRGRQEPSP